MRLLLIFALLFVPITAQALTLDFEDLPDSTPVADQYVSLGVFWNAGALTAGFNLLEWEFPARSAVT